MAKACTVFISSTSEDLKEYRLAVRDAVLAAGLRPEMMEYFAATGGPPLAECLRRVSPCDVVVVLVAQRYGWVPPDQPGSESKSITWLECAHAAGQNKELLVFFPDPSHPWPTERTEAYRLTAAFNEGTFSRELPAEIARNVGKLGEFRQWLEIGRTRNKFTTPDDLRAKVLQALYQWIDKQSTRGGAAEDGVAFADGTKTPAGEVRHFSQSDLYQIRDLLAEAGFAQNDRQDLLFVSLNQRYVSTLPAEGAPIVRLLKVLNALNQTPALTDGELPFRTLLINAVESSKPLPVSAKLAKFLDRLRMA